LRVIKRKKKIRVERARAESTPPLSPFPDWVIWNKVGITGRGLRISGRRNTAEMCGCSEAGSYLRLIDFVYHSTPGLRVIKKKKRNHTSCTQPRV